jgi:hypothetical protein
MRIDPSGTSDDRKLTGYGYWIFGPGDRVSDWIASRAGGGPYSHCRIGAGGVAIPPWCRHRVGAV